MDEYIPHLFSGVWVNSLTLFLMMMMTMTTYIHLHAFFAYKPKNSDTFFQTLIVGFSADVVSQIKVK